MLFGILLPDLDVATVGIWVMTISIMVVIGPHLPIRTARLVILVSVPRDLSIQRIRMETGLMREQFVVSRNSGSMNLGQRASVSDTVD